MLAPGLPDDLIFLLIYLLDAAKTNLLFGESDTLDEALSAITQDERDRLAVHFPHINTDYALSETQIFMDLLASRHLAPILWISPGWLLRACPWAKLDHHLVSDILVDDLILRLTSYLSHAPVIIRIGIYRSWLASEADTEVKTNQARLADVVCGSNAPLLQKLIQMIGDASAASNDLQIVKDRIQTMTSRELSLVLTNAGSESLFESFEMESTAAGSIGQGHLAKLLDGTPVFVKVKRLGVAALMRRESEIFNSPYSTHSDSRSPPKPTHSPWANIAETLIQETSFSREVSNQQLLKSQWTHFPATIKIVDVISAHPASDPSILIMRVAPGDTLGRCNIRFPIGLKNAVTALNQFLHQFYLNTLFYDPPRAPPNTSFLPPSGTETETETGPQNLGFAPADPHAGNLMIYACPVSGAITLTIIDTASVCTITPDDRDKVIDLLLAVALCDAEGVAEVLGIDERDVVIWHTAVSTYRAILTSSSDSSGPASSRTKGSESSATSLDSRILKNLVRVIEYTSLTLHHPALSPLLSFGKAQLQVLDAVMQFSASHEREMRSLGVNVESLVHVMIGLLKSEFRGGSAGSAGLGSAGRGGMRERRGRRGREVVGRVVWGLGAVARRKFGASFTAWETHWDDR